MITEELPKKTDKYICENCDKTLSSKQRLQTHIATCDKKYIKLTL